MDNGCPDYGPALYRLDGLDRLEKAMIGQTIGHYKILEELGRGGMGVVYKARDTKLDRIVALKFLPHHLTISEAERVRFLQEAKAAAALNHPNACSIFRIDEHDGQQFIEMEYVSGETLRHKTSMSPLNADEAIGYAIQIGEALQDAHSKGIVHRDVKSENIMVNEKNQIKVMDFGLAKLKGSLKLTKESSTVGTLSYMAPEQIQGGEADARSDIFSFGVVLFEMLTGQMPFRGEHDAAIMYSVLNEEADSVLKYRSDLPPDVGRIIGRALEKDPADRYQHVDDMVSELRRLQKQTSKPSRPVETQSPVPLPDSATKPVSPSRRRRLYAGVGLGVVVLAGFLSYLLFRPPSSFDSLAVLPFVNSGGDPATEYLSDGMTESIINSLTRIPQLRVVPRSTVFRFKGKDSDPQEVGTSLNVSAVLTGRVLQHGDELNIQLDLIDVRNQAQVWGKQYRSGLNEVITLQNEIVTDVSEMLRLSLSGETREDLAKAATDNPDAYKLYLQGRYFWQKRKAVEIRKATDFFNQAIALDPGFALAYAGLADCYVLMEQYAGRPWREFAPLAEKAARTALELDGSLGEALTTLAFVRARSWDWSGAERDFRTAITLSPNYPTLYHWYGLLLADQNRMDEYFAAIEKALSLDPLSPVILINMGMAYDRSKDDEETATMYFEKALELDAGFAPAYRQLGRMQVHRGRLDQGLTNLQKSVDLSSRASEDLSSVGHCLGLMGRTEEAVMLLDELRDRYVRKETPAYNVARIYAGLKESTKVFEWLQRDYEDRTGFITWVGYDFEWEEYHSDPRYQTLLKNIGLPPRTIAQ
jgi:serine/threonine-protein kinase